MSEFKESDIVENTLLDILFNDKIDDFKDIRSDLVLKKKSPFALRLFDDTWSKVIS
jgi:hypothetical protein